MDNITTTMISLDQKVLIKVLLEVSVVTLMVVDTVVLDRSSNNDPLCQLDW